jgi:hypothetical protein
MPWIAYYIRLMKPDLYLYKFIFPSFIDVLMIKKRRARVLIK